MTINTYGTLKTAVSNYLNRSDLSGYIPDLISFGAQRIFYGSGDPYATPPLRVPAMMAQDTGSVAGGYVAFPAEFIELIRIAAVSGARTYKLEYQPLTAFEAESPSSANWYTYRDNAIYTGVDASTDYVLDYYQSFTLTNDTDTDWILTNAPNVYVYASLLEAAPFIGDDPRIAIWLNLYRSTVAGLNRTTARQGSGLAARLK